MTELGKTLMESMFDAWCDEKCKEFTPEHNGEHKQTVEDVVKCICELTGAAREQRFHIEHILEQLVNTTEHDTFADGFYIGVAVAHGKVF